MSSDTAADAPLLVVRGAPIWGTPIVGLGYVLVPALLALAVVVLPRITPDTDAQVGALIVAATAGGLLSSAALRFALCRRGEIVFRDERIEIDKSWRSPRSVTWADLSGWSEPSPDYLQLHQVDELRPTAVLTVPTPRAEVREQVLALLRERGLERC